VIGEGKKLFTAKDAKGAKEIGKLLTQDHEGNTEANESP